jgi:hypothetical protein
VQGKSQEAEEMYQRALVGYENDLGPNHRSTLGTVDHLGSCKRQRRGRNPLIVLASLKPQFIFTLVLKWW